MKRLYVCLLIFFISFPLLRMGALYAEASGNQTTDPVGLYLTWENDPTTTMTVRWITPDSVTSNTIEYRRGGFANWQSIEGTHSPMPDKYPYLIHRGEITGLSPDSDYFFRFADSEESPTFKFRTMPQRFDQPIRFVEGGDMLHDDPSFLADTNRRAAEQDPHFAVLGGDIAYSAPRTILYSENFENWLVWFKTWKETMITPKGHLIPMIITIGNHEVIGRFRQRPERAKFFYALFRRPTQYGYQVVDFNENLSFFLLDSDHTNAIDTEQKTWLETELKERKDVRHKFAVYHVPAYPSVRKFEGKVSKRIREHWVPLFEENGINTAFEHHDHAYKRTKPIYQGKINPDKGVMYIGDGSWGVKKARVPKTSKDVWYLEKSKSLRHFILVTLYGAHRFYMAIDGEGQIFDYAKN